MSSTITLTRDERDVHRGSPSSSTTRRSSPAIWDDLTEFFYEANPAYKQVGARRANLIDTGIFDHPDAYDATYANAARLGRPALGDARASSSTASS